MEADFSQGVGTPQSTQKEMAKTGLAWPMFKKKMKCQNTKAPFSTSQMGKGF